MILYFSFNNFRSVKNDCEIDFRKISLSQHKESLINDSVLPVCAIYGPNGGGKSTIVLALGYLCNLISIPINQYKGFANYATPTFKPFMLDEKSREKKTEFCIIFTLNKNSKEEYKYYLSIFKGEIIEESLYEKKEYGKPALIFKRNRDMVEINKSYLSIKQQNSSIPGSSVPYLSLCTILFKNSLIAEIGNWFTNIGIIDFSDSMLEIAFPAIFAIFCQNTVFKKGVDSLLKKFDLISNYEIVDVPNPITGLNDKSIKTYHKVNGKEFELTYNDESMGTKKVMQVAPSIVLALQKGSLFAIDELDAKLHPKLLEFIISLFTNPKVNVNGAQLMFTSHDMYTLNSDVFRRDEIWFACKNEEESTIVYSLADIKGEDKRTLRADLSFSKQYLSGRYGADPYYNKMITWEEISNDKKQKLVKQEKEI